MPKADVPLHLRLSLSPTEAAALAGFARQTIDRAIREGALPSGRIGERHFVRRTDLDTWLEAQVVPSPHSPIVLERTGDVKTRHGTKGGASTTSRRPNG